MHWKYKPQDTQKNHTRHNLYRFISLSIKANGMTTTDHHPILYSPLWFLPFLLISPSRLITPNPHINHHNVPIFQLSSDVLADGIPVNFRPWHFVLRLQFVVECLKCPEKRPKYQNKAQDEPIRERGMPTPRNSSLFFNRLGNREMLKRHFLVKGKD